VYQVFSSLLWLFSRPCWCFREGLWNLNTLLTVPISPSRHQQELCLYIFHIRAPDSQGCWCRKMLISALQPFFTPDSIQLLLVCSLPYYVFRIGCQAFMFSLKASIGQFVISINYGFTYHFSISRIIIMKVT
jgi:hypothetical protein